MVVPGYDKSTAENFEDLKKFAGRVERLVIVGSTFALKTATVTNDGEGGPGRVLTLAPDSNNVFIVKDPKVFIGKEWEISFK